MPAPHLTDDPVDTLLARLDAGLVATRRQRQDARREIEGDLREAVAARVAGGSSAADAAAAVVRELGDPAGLAAELSAELLALRGRRYAGASAGAAGLLALLWIATMPSLVAMPGFHLDPDAGWLMPVSRMFEGLTPLLAVVALVGWAAIRRWASMDAVVAVAGLLAVFAAGMLGGLVAMLAVVEVAASGIWLYALLLTASTTICVGLMGHAAPLLARVWAVRRSGRQVA